MDPRKFLTRAVETCVYFALTVGCGSRQTYYDAITPVYWSKITDDPDVIGYCYIYETGERVIQLDPDYWETTTDTQRHMLMLHERGHCDWNLEHNERKRTDDNCAASLMYPVIPSDECWNRHSQEYIEEYNGEIIDENFAPWSSLGEIE